MTKTCCTAAPPLNWEASGFLSPFRWRNPRHHPALIGTGTRHVDRQPWPFPSERISRFSGLPSEHCPFFELSPLKPQFSGTGRPRRQCPGREDSCLLVDELRKRLPPLFFSKTLSMPLSKPRLCPHMGFPPFSEPVKAGFFFPFRPPVPFPLSPSLSS